MSFNISKVAIIGAGPTGLASAKYLLAQKPLASITLFEQQPESRPRRRLALHPRRPSRAPRPADGPFPPARRPAPDGGSGGRRGGGRAGLHRRPCTRSCTPISPGPSWRSGACRFLLKRGLPLAGTHKGLRPPVRRGGAAPNPLLARGHLRKPPVRLRHREVGPHIPLDPRRLRGKRHLRRRRRSERALLRPPASPASPTSRPTPRRIPRPSSTQSSSARQRPSRTRWSW